MLLTLHPKVGRWLQMGGHCEPGDATLAAAALREATEESGIDGLDLVGAARCAWTGTPSAAAPRRARAPRRPVRRARLGRRDARSDESLDLRWWPVDALPPGTDDSVRALVGSAVRSPADPAGARTPELEPTGCGGAASSDARPEVQPSLPVRLGSIFAMVAREGLRVLRRRRLRGLVELLLAVDRPGPRPAVGGPGPAVQEAARPLGPGVRLEQRPEPRA